MVNRLLLIMANVLLLTCFSGYLNIHASHHQPVSESASLDLAENSKSAILIERDTGKVLFEKNADESLPPASMTKIMTMLLIMEALDKGEITLEETVRVSENAASMGGSQIFLEAGEEMTVNDLLKGIAVASGNDASVAMAEKIAGSEKAFVELMNKKAKELGLKNTVFQNATGLPAENHTSTAAEMATMAKALLKYENITDYTSIYEDYLREGKENEFWLVNTNKLVKFYDGVDGLKTGFTNEAKYCLTATAEKEGMRVIAVVMGAGSTKERNSDVSQMLDYAYSKYATKPLFEKNQSITSFEWLKADKQNVDIITNDSISIVHQKGEDLSGIETKMKINQNISLPIKKGTTVGKLQVMQGGKVISETDLVLSEDMKKASTFQLWKRTWRSLFSL
ncbi:D-alanyl-D-alanine carboxypeptidase [Gracilibacillus dipsosauri]|uniref:serine-type D-Ala-D-Ala carboxypeptidase n=2 Tax=Gracilibacillus dipsosauri TaxID=178340 RepID=A0A317L5J5_9BACI|nr:D-alanyl-D-alanine carboxypeptidase family protein [Gracilibacillus dipsosauri]PWU69099.1 D-alanyl-D-alanine carboxypeptidase [Gracilibacillus dipsosauri]